MFSAFQSNGELDPDKIREFLKAKLDSSSYRNMIIDKVYYNPKSQEGTMYEQFKENYEKSKNKDVQLLFHGTSAQNVNNILIHGLDPALRGKIHGQAYGRGEYFSDSLDTSSLYMKQIGSANRIIVFAILKDPHVMVHDSRNIIVVNSTSHQLPIFVINVRQTYQYPKQNEQQPWTEVKKATICEIPECLLDESSKKRKRENESESDCK